MKYGEQIKYMSIAPNEIGKQMRPKAKKHKSKMKNEKFKRNNENDKKKIRERKTIYGIKIMHSLKTSL